MSGSSARMRRLRRCGLLVGAAVLAAGAALALADDKASASSKPPPSVTKPHSLDLSAPPISHVLTARQIQDLTTEQDDDTPTEDVTVSQPLYEAPVPVGPFLALPWALFHPLEAWRIIEPIPDD